MYPLKERSIFCEYLDLFARHPSMKSVGGFPSTRMVNSLDCPPNCAVVTLKVLAALEQSHPKSLDKDDLISRYADGPIALTE